MISYRGSAERKSLKCHFVCGYRVIFGRNLHEKKNDFPFLRKTIVKKKTIRAPLSKGKGVNMSSKITIIGAGSVGATIAYTLSNEDIASNIVLIDINKQKVEGEVMDIAQGTCFRDPISIVAGEYEDAKGSDIVIITSGIARKPGQTRIELTQTNVNIMKSIAPQIVKAARENAKRAGVDGLIHFQQRPVHHLSHPKKYGFVITNPPYGERLEEKEDLPALYRDMGKAFAGLDGWSEYVITAYEDAERYIGKKAAKNRKIYNGMMKTYFYMFPGPKPPRRKKMVQPEE